MTFISRSSKDDNDPNSGLLAGHDLRRDEGDNKVTVMSRDVGESNVVSLDHTTVHFVVKDTGDLVNTNNYVISVVNGSLTINPAPVTPDPDPDPNPDPGPNPTPTPTPVPTPAPTPVTPVAPVTPDEEEEEPEIVEEIEDEETPQASPETDADKEEDKTETIEDEETAQAGAPEEGSWALLNLILMVLTVVAGLVMLALRFARKTGMAHLLGIVPAIVALVAFFVTEDMTLPMVMIDKWTLIMAVIALVQAALFLLGRNSAQDEDDQPREQY